MSHYLNNNKERDLSIDVIKAFATILVIAGHVIQYTNVDFDHSIFFKIIYSFHMPLFMFISGYLMPETINNSFLRIKFKQLVIPFTLWSALLIALNNPELIKNADSYQFLDRLYKLFLQPDDGGLWFLWVLFLNFLVFTLLRGRYQITLSVVIIISLTILQFINHDFALFGLGLFRWHYFFFVFGFLAHNNNILKKLKINTWIILITTLALMNQWNRVAITSFFGIEINSNTLTTLLTLIVKYLCASGAIVVIFSIKEKLKYTNKWINILSVDSLGYYATQFIFLGGATLFWSLKDLNSYLDQLYIFILIITFCTLIIQIINRYSFTRQYLLGKLSKKHS